MKTSSKTILASTLLTALLAGTSAYAEGRACGLVDYVDNAEATETVEFKKVSFEATTVEPDYGVNR